MGLSGESEDELRMRSTELDTREADVDNRESTLKSGVSHFDHKQKLLEDEKSEFEKERKKFRGVAREIHEAIAEERAGLEQRYTEISKLESDAKAGFSDSAKALDNETKRNHQDEAERLRQQSEKLAGDRQRVESTKSELVLREQNIAAAEQVRDTGFNDARAALELELGEKRAAVESEITEYRSKLFSAVEEEIASQRASRLKAVVASEEAERDRIQAEISAERDAWTDRQESSRKQVEGERKEYEKHKAAVSALESEVEGRKAELEANERMLERKEQRLEQQWQKRSEDLDDVVEARLEETRLSIESKEQSQKDENARLREGLRIQTELTDVFDQLKRQLGENDPAEVLRELNGKTDELKRLREELVSRPSEADRERFQEAQKELERQRARVDELEARRKDDDATLAEAAEIRRRNSELDAENKSLTQKASIFEGAANEALGELERLRSAYERPAEVAARYREIELPHIKADKLKSPAKAEIDETTWLTGVINACENYGLHFNPRIVKAFHTALKTAEWSPLTVLAGVSGTGKSELPRLYSHFGGLLFEPLSVQPNWDSQESMLGFFNSIDNKFDAQPILRFLAQSQKPWVEISDTDEGYPGLQDAVCMVLLDEMNLAHPELYFAEFLSKLEFRRGMKGSDVPFLPVKIGAGLPAYELPLGRNVLWAGTMNQDETTKSLSDKVLDRSIIINFPRPMKLKSRLKLSPLDEKNRGPLLHKVSWQNWLAQSSKSLENDIEPFKTFIEDMNEALGVVGRAIGHRAWQSVEYYMANYPDVRAAQNGNDKDELSKALHVAFEDQLVQKVMPKLRGIDTRGKSRTKCLDQILDQINEGIGGNSFNLAEDFELACELGYGQFIWQSANYLRDTDQRVNAPTDKSDSDLLDDTDASSAKMSNAARQKGGSKASKAKQPDLVQPPSSFCENEPDREAKWDELSKKQKRLFGQSENA
jgi:hypothetical protein